MTDTAKSNRPDSGAIRPDLGSTMPKDREEQQSAAYTERAETIREVLGHSVNGEYSRELATRALEDLVAEIKELRAWKAEALRLYRQRRARKALA